MLLLFLLRASFKIYLLSEGASRDNQCLVSLNAAGVDILGRVYNGSLVMYLVAIVVVVPLISILPVAVGFRNDHCSVASLRQCPC